MTSAERAGLRWERLGAASSSSPYLDSSSFAEAHLRRLEPAGKTPSEFKSPLPHLRCIGPDHWGSMNSSGPLDEMTPGRGSQALNWSVRILGGFWAIVGGFAIIASLLGLRGITKDPAAGYDLLPAFLLFFFLPLGILSTANAWALLTNKPGARWMTISLSSLLILVGGGFLIYREWFVFRPPQCVLIISGFSILVQTARRSMPHASDAGRSPPGGCSRWGHGRCCGRSRSRCPPWGSRTAP